MSAKTLRQAALTGGIPAVCILIILAMVAGCSDYACPSGQSVCNGVCTNLQNDPLNCGGCQKACTVGKVCQNGQCSEPSRTTPATSPPGSATQGMISFTYNPAGTSGSLSTEEINEITAAGGSFTSLGPDGNAFDIQSVSIPVSLLKQPVNDWNGHTWADIASALRSRSYFETDT